jgi:prophage regulatory protein
MKNQQPEITFLRLGQVAERIGMGTSTIWAMIARGEFPPPIKLTAKAIGWPAHVIQEWCVDRIAAAEAKPNKYLK